MKLRHLMTAMIFAASCSGSPVVLDNIFPADEPGAAILVKQGDSILFEKCYGIADIGTKAPITQQTAFNIASISKQFTAAAVMQLAEQGKLQLTDHVREYFPEYTDSIWQNIEIRHLLSQSSGIPDKRNYPREVKIKGDDNLAVEYLLSLDELHFEPGSDYEYVNPTFTLLGKLIERVSGEEFEQYMQKHIFEPAGMLHTLYFGTEKKIDNMAHGYEWAQVSGTADERTAKRDISGPKNWYEFDYGEETFFATRPDGGIYSSIEDMSKWIPALLAGKVISPESLQQMWNKHIKVSGSKWSGYQNRPDTWYGLGWFIEEKNGNRIIYHTGDNGGFTALEAYYPDKDILILILSNRADWDRYEIWKKIEAAIS